MNAKPIHASEHRKGAFTLIEVLTAIVIIGILASLAVPVYLDNRQEAIESAEEAVVAAVRTGIHNKHARSAVEDGPAWVAALDSVSAGGEASNANPFFAEVLSSPVVESWTKGSDANTYLSPTGQTYYYDPLTGRFATELSGEVLAQADPVLPSITSFVNQSTFTAGEDLTNGTWYGTGYSEEDGIVRLDHASNNWQRRALVQAFDMPEAGTYEFTMDYRYSDYHRQLHYWQIIGVKDGTTVDLTSASDVNWNLNTEGTEQIYREYSRDGQDNEQWVTQTNSFDVTEEMVSQFDRLLITLVGSRRSQDILEWGEMTTNLPGGSGGN